MEYRHLALFVGDDLRRAEQYYAGLFEMGAVVREGIDDGGRWAQFPLESSWDDAERAGLTIRMVA
jgi:hypothetical protein